MGTAIDFTYTKGVYSAIRDIFAWIDQGILLWVHNIDNITQIITAPKSSKKCCYQLFSVRYTEFRSTEKRRFFVLNSIEANHYYLSELSIRPTAPSKFFSLVEPPLLTSES